MEVNLILLISRVKRARLRPAFRASVHYVQRIQKQSSLSRFIKVGTLRDHYGDPPKVYSESTFVLWKDIKA